MTDDERHDLHRLSIAPGPLSLEDAARFVVLAHEGLRDARNGDGHRGEPHDTILHFPVAPGQIEVWDYVGDCAACGGAQYGAEDVEHMAFGDLRAALGLERRAWEYDRRVPE